jgi:hypothetical protein
MTTCWGEAAHSVTLRRTLLEPKHASRRFVWCPWSNAERTKVEKVSFERTTTEPRSRFGGESREDSVTHVKRVITPARLSNGRSKKKQAAKTLHQPSTLPRPPHQRRTPKSTQSTINALLTKIRYCTIPRSPANDIILSLWYHLCLRDRAINKRNNDNNDSRVERRCIGTAAAVLPLRGGSSSSSRSRSCSRRGWCRRRRRRPPR